MAIPDPHLRIAHLERELNWAQLKIQVLEERPRRHRIGVLGPHSETLSDLQLELLVEAEPGVTAEEVAAEAGPRRLRNGRGNIYLIRAVSGCRKICSEWKKRSPARPVSA